MLRILNKVKLITWSKILQITEIGNGYLKKIWVHYLFKART